MKKFLKREKGITLMVLVVTIIILLILATVTVKLALDDKGVLSEAREAVNEWDRVSADEENQLSKLANDMKKLRNETIGNGSSGEESGGNEGTISKPLEGITGNETINTITKDKLGNKIVIPAGFKVINPEDDVTKGIVIEDMSANDETSKGNQYVWIPVTHVNGEKTNTLKDSEGNEHTVELARYTFNRGTYTSSTMSYSGTGQIETKVLDGGLIDTYFYEQTKEEAVEIGNNNTVAKDINGFKNSVANNGGYFIARFEGGDSTTINERNSSSSQSIIPVFKENQIPYTYILQSNAADLVGNLYNNQINNYISDLINSYAWDTAIVFIQEFSKDSKYSIMVSMGSGPRSKTGQVTDKNGNKDLKCNIYDMAMNVHEWTTETWSNGKSHILSMRGGSIKLNYYTALRANATESYSQPHVSFRRNYIYKIVKTNINY